MIFSRLSVQKRRLFYKYHQLMVSSIHKEFMMRLDKYLKVSRLIKRRTVANDACDGERVSVNGRQVKASYQVKVGDVIEIAFGQRTLKVEVTAVTENVTKADAPAMYKELP